MALIWVNSKPDGIIHPHASGSSHTAHPVSKAHRVRSGRDGTAILCICQRVTPDRLAFRLSQGLRRSADRIPAVAPADRHPGIRARPRSEYVISPIPAPGRRTYHALHTQGKTPGGKGQT